MQGWTSFIPTEKKIAYLNALMQVGFDTLDFGSFVSAKAHQDGVSRAAFLKLMNGVWEPAQGYA